MTDLFNNDRDTLLAEMEAWKKSQHYAYINRDGKTVLARDLEDELVAAQEKLDRIVKAIENIDRSTPEGFAIYAAIMSVIHNG